MFPVRAQAADFKQFKLDECSFHLLQQGAPLLVVSASGFQRDGGANG